MAYLILFVAATFVLSAVFHLKQQLRQTAAIRRDIREARRKKILTDLHPMRNKDI